MRSPLKWARDKIGSQKFSDTDRLAQWIQHILGRGSSNTTGLNAPSFSTSIAVYRCVNVIAESYARVPTGIYRGEKKVAESHPLNKLLKSPNDVQTRADLIYMISQHLLLFGNAYVYKDAPNSRGLPRSLVPLDPRAVEPIFGKNQFELKGWKVGVVGEDVSYRPGEIIPFVKSASPNNPLKGVPPLEVTRRTVETDELARLWNHSVLENSGSLSGILRWKGDGKLDPRDAAATREAWMQAYSGAANADTVAVLGGNFEFQQVGMSQRDMQFLQQRRWNLADISRGYNVPLLFLNEFESTNLSDAGLRVQKELFFDTTIIPFGEPIEERWNRHLVQEFDQNLSYRNEWDQVEALRDTAIEKLEQARRLAQLGYPMNIINKELGLKMPDIEWGDEHIVAGGMTTARRVLEYSSDDVIERGEPTAPDAPVGEPDPDQAPGGDDPNVPSPGRGASDGDTLPDGRGPGSKKGEQSYLNHPGAADAVASMNRALMRFRGKVLRAGKVGEDGTELGVSLYNALHPSLEAYGVNISTDVQSRIVSQGTQIAWATSEAMRRAPDGQEANYARRLLNLARGRLWDIANTELNRENRNQIESY